MHSLGVSLGVHKQYFGVLSPFLSAFSLVLSGSLGLLFLVFWPESWAFSYPSPSQTAHDSALVPGPSSKCSDIKKKKKKGNGYFPQSLGITASPKVKFPPSILGAFHPKVSTACHHSHFGILDCLELWCEQTEERKEEEVGDFFPCLSTLYSELQVFFLSILFPLRIRGFLLKLSLSLPWCVSLVFRLH